MAYALILEGAVIQVEAEYFPTAPGLIWEECGLEVEPGWTHDGDTFAPPPEPDLAAHLSVARDAKVYGGLEVGGTAFPTDERTQRNLVAMRILAKEDPAYTVDFKTPDGFVTLDATTIIAVADAVAAHVQACFSAEAAVLPDIGDHTTIPEVEAAYAAALALEKGEA